MLIYKESDALDEIITLFKEIEEINTFEILWFTRSKFLHICEMFIIKNFSEDFYGLDTEHIILTLMNICGCDNISQWDELMSLYDTSIDIITNFRDVEEQRDRFVDLILRNTKGENDDN